MTYFNTVRTKLQDSADVDAFGRLRVSTPFTIFNSKQLYNSGTLDWTFKAINGASASYSERQASSILYVTNTSASKATKQTKNIFYYQPGKSFFTLMTFNFKGGINGIVKRLGYFNDDDGIFLEHNGTDVNFVIRDSVDGFVKETRVSQSNWSIDKLDGSGPSQIVLDLTKTHVFTIDFQWLGVGRVRCGFDIDGRQITAHEFNHANIKEHVYISSPNLPIRYEIENFTGINSSSMEQICCSVVSEGGFQPVNQSFAIDRGANIFTTTQGKTVPVISIRPLASKNKTSILPSEIQILTTTDTDFRWGLYLNPTFGGTDHANWTLVNSYSAVEYDISRTQANVLTGGILLKSGYAAGGGGPGGQQIGSLLQHIFEIGQGLGRDLDGNTDELVLAVETITAGTANIYGGFAWKEIE